MSTLKDIAQHTKVSVSTVSRVLNNDQTLNVNPQTRKSIIDYAKKIGYQKKPLKKNHRLIGVIIWIEQSDELKDPYFMEIRYGIERAAEASKTFIMTLYKSNDDYQLEKLKDVDGLICIGKFTRNEIEKFKKISPSMVFVDSSPQPEDYPSIMIDYYASTKSVIDYLLAKDYSSIGFIGGTEQFDNTVQEDEYRHKYAKKILEKNHRYHEEHFHIGQFTVDSGYQRMVEALKKPLAKAYFCANDMIAFGVLKALHENNIKIPEDTAIIGFNDVAQAAYTHPALTTLKIYTEAMGEEALVTLLKMIENPEQLPIKKIMPTKLIVRQSA